MALRYYFLLIWTLGFSSCSVSQNTTLESNVDRDIAMATDKYYVDQLDQVIVLSSDGDLIKYDNQLQELFRYADNTLGEISHIDPFNPLSVLVYFEDYNTIVYLDNTFSVTGTVSLQEWDYFDISTIAASNDGNIWLYDPTSNRLIKSNDQGREILSSNNLNDYGIDELNPILIKERNNNLWVLDEQYGIIVLDNFGSYIKSIPITGITDFQVDGEQVIYWKDGQFNVVSLKLLEQHKISLEHNSAWDLGKISSRYFYLQDSKGIKRINRS